MFARIPEKIEFKKASYVSIKAGKPVLFQLLDERAKDFYVHTLRLPNNFYLKVVHDPTSELHTSKAFNEQYKPRTVYRTNVLNVTPVVVSPSGNVYNAFNGRGSVPEKDPTDGSDLTQIEIRPWNEVQILERGVMLFGQINSQIDTLMHTRENFNHREMVFQIQATGSGRQMQTVVFHRPDIEALSAEILEGFELNDISLPIYSDDEVRLLMSGVSLKDIYQARKNATEDDEEPMAAGLNFSKGLPGL